MGDVGVSCGMGCLLSSYLGLPLESPFNSVLGNRMEKLKLGGGQLFGKAIFYLEGKVYLTKSAASCITLKKYLFTTSFLVANCLEKCY